MDKIKNLRPSGRGEVRMANKKTYLFDIDGVIIDVPELYTGMSKHVNENNREKRLKMIEFFKKPLWRRMGTLLLKPTKNIHILRQIIADGHDVHLVSRRAHDTDLKEHPEGKGLLIPKWLEKNNIIIPLKNIHMRKFNVDDKDFLPEAEFKSFILTQTLADGFWDDKPEIVEHIRQEHKNGRFEYDCPAHLFTGWDDVERRMKESNTFPRPKGRGL